MKEAMEMNGKANQIISNDHSRHKISSLFEKQPKNEESN